MMYHGLLRNASFWEFLFTVDEDLAAAPREAGLLRAAGDCTAPITRASHAADARSCRNLTATA